MQLTFGIALGQLEPECIQTEFRDGGMYYIELGKHFWSRHVLRVTLQHIYVCLERDK